MGSSLRYAYIIQYRDVFHSPMCSLTAVSRFKLGARMLLETNLAVS
jgi:hypothetical protein